MNDHQDLIALTIKNLMIANNLVAGEDSTLLCEIYLIKTFPKIFFFFLVKWGDFPQDLS